jgi:hypothetical protein
MFKARFVGLKGDKTRCVIITFENTSLRLSSKEGEKTRTLQNSGKKVNLEG